MPSSRRKIPSFLLVLTLITVTQALAQQGKIRCYFNTPVNKVLSTGNNAVYLNNTFPDTIAAYINRAKYSIDLAMYNFTATTGSNVAKIATAINAAVNRGIRVRWLYNSSTSNTGLTLLNTAVKTFGAPDNSNYIMHNKFMIIDMMSLDSNDVILQTGSYNFSDQQTTGDINNILFIQSRQLANAFYKEFNKMWGGPDALPNPALATFSKQKTKSDQTLFNVNGTMIEVFFSPKDSLGAKLQNNIQTANEEIFFGVYTFTDSNIANLIKWKKNSGVRVRGIMDENSTSFNAYGILNPELGADLKIFSGGNLYHNKNMLIDPGAPDSDPQIFTGSFNWTIQGQTSNDENAIVIHDASIANQYFQAMCANYTLVGGIACVAPPCPNGDATLISNVRGNSYQCQINTGSGFSNLSNNSNYNGINNIGLSISQAPSSWYGYQYRCLVNNTTYSDVTTLRFIAYWNGSTSNNWHDVQNWNCGNIPDQNTDVVINGNLKFFPAINQSTTCRSVRLSKEAQIKIMEGVHVILTGQQ